MPSRSPGNACRSKGSVKISIFPDSIWKIQYGIDEFEQRAGRGVEFFEIGHLLQRERRFAEQMDETRDGVQRGADFVTHGRQKIALRLIGAFDFADAYLFRDVMNNTFENVYPARVVRINEPAFLQRPAYVAVNLDAEHHFHGVSYIEGRRVGSVIFIFMSTLMNERVAPDLVSIPLPEDIPAVSGEFCLLKRENTKLSALEEELADRLKRLGKACCEEYARAASKG